MSHQAKVFAGLLAAVYPGQQQSIPPPSDPKKLKQWCTRQLEEGSFSTRKEFSLAASKFMFRKVLPSGGSNPVPSYLEKLSEPRTVNPEFLGFCSGKIANLFPKGWDKHYQDVCSRVTIAQKSTLEFNRKAAGARHFWTEVLSREDFLECVLEGRYREIPSTRKVQVVSDSGKDRIVTVASALQHALLPLHLCLYAHLSKKSWLLRGDAKPNKFKDFTVTSGEIFVSGDYESATDNFVTEHSLSILAMVLDRCAHVPPGVRAMALGHISSNTLVYEQISVVQRSGQLMGDYLSFPLLCLLNYLAFKYAVPREVPLRINGDDIVFRCTRQEFDTWSETVTSAGLTLSKGKTLVHRVFFSLNSTFFQAGRKKASLVPVIRSKSVFAALEKGGSKLQARLRECGRGFWASAREEIKKTLILYHKNGVRSVSCSINRGLRTRVAPQTLKECAVLDHELYYIRLPDEYDKPPPVRDSEGVPEGWVRKRVGPEENWFCSEGRRPLKGRSPFKTGVLEAKVKESEKEFGRACYQHAWRKTTRREDKKELDEEPRMGYQTRSQVGVRGLRLLCKLSGMQSLDLNPCPGDSAKKTVVRPPVSYRSIRMRAKAAAGVTMARLCRLYESMSRSGIWREDRRLWVYDVNPVTALNDEDFEVLMTSRRHIAALPFCDE